MVTEKPSVELADWVLGQADDQLILAHRNSEWTGHAPILEEDIAFANIALDEMGHAQLLYQIHAELLGKEPSSYPDALVFQRQAPSFRNVQMVELPKGDWAFSILRQYLFDAWESIQLEASSSSKHSGLAEASAAMVNEEKYHINHTAEWVRRLGLGTEESQRRLQRALDGLWRPAHQLFILPEEHGFLVDEGFVPDPQVLRTRWRERVIPHLEASDLEAPNLGDRPLPGRSQHGEQLMDLLGEMQMVARIFPGEEW
ncbi:MAG: 1,2-phenylacetyl-CoA epoxidase subunit PaaC [Anaerolineales bacterium]